MGGLEENHNEGRSTTYCDRKIPTFENPIFDLNLLDPPV